jgi:hypothetical protein
MQGHAMLSVGPQMLPLLTGITLECVVCTLLHSTSGLVVKPVVGISDAATDLFQGVKGTTDDIASFGGIASSSSTTDTSSSRNSSNSTVVDKLQALVLGVGSSSGGQVRPRRTLYGPQKARVLRPYVLADAQAAALLIEKGTQYNPQRGSSCYRHINYAK